MGSDNDDANLIELIDDVELEFVWNMGTPSDTSAKYYTSIGITED